MVAQRVTWLWGLAVEGLDVEGVEQFLLDLVWGGGQEVAEQGQPVQQAGIPAGFLGGLPGQGGQGAADVLAFGFQFTEPLQVPGAHGFDGGRVRVHLGEGLHFADVGVLGRIDLLEPFAQPGGLLLPPCGVLRRAGWELLGQEGGPVGAEDAGGEELPDLLDEHVFADRDGGRVVGGLGSVAGVAGVVGAQVVHVVDVGAVGVVPG